MSYYELKQMEKYGNILPGSDAEPEETDEDKCLYPNMESGNEHCEWLIEDYRDYNDL